MSLLNRRIYYWMYKRTFNFNKFDIFTTAGHMYHIACIEQGASQSHSAISSWLYLIQLTEKEGIFYDNI